MFWSVGFVGLTSCRMPKERYLPSMGRDGGTRLQSSAGREVKSAIDGIGGPVERSVSVEVWLEGSTCRWSRSMFSKVKDL